MDPKATPKPRDLTSPAAESRTGSGMRYIGNVSGCRPAKAHNSRHHATNTPTILAVRADLQRRIRALLSRSTVSRHITHLARAGFWTIEEAA